MSKTLFFSHYLHIYQNITLYHVYLVTALGVNLHKSIGYLLVLVRKRTAISSVAYVGGLRDVRA